MDAETERRRRLIANIIRFLQNEVGSATLSEERKESIEVAIQCLETAYEVDDNIKQKIEAEGPVDLLATISLPQAKPEVSPEAKAEAIECKNRGNTAMKNSEYSLAIDEYTKAISLDPYNAVYYCNRAAAYSRLEKHQDAIQDCKEAIKLDPAYGKAYGRLGIAYSNMNMYEEARQAYKNALKYDPGNQMYETNLKLAEERLIDSAATSQPRQLDLSQFINNPTLINMATQMLSDPNFRSMMSGLMGNPNDPDFDALFQAGQTLAYRMHNTDPNFVDQLRRAVNEQTGGAGAASSTGSDQNPSPPQNEDPSQKKPDA